MKYSVYWTRTAVRDLKKLDRNIAEGLLGLLKRLL